MCFIIAQRTVVPENVCEKCQKTCDVNGNRQQTDAFLDLNPGNKWKPSTVTVSSDLSPCEPFGNNNNNEKNSANNNNDNTKNNYNDNTNNNNNFDDDDDDDDEDGLEPERPYLTLISSPLKQRHPLHQYQQQQRQPRFSSTSSLDRIGANRERSTDSLDRVEFCSTTDYR